MISKIHGPIGLQSIPAKDASGDRPISALIPNILDDLAIGLIQEMKKYVFIMLLQIGW